MVFLCGQWQSRPGTPTRARGAVQRARAALQKRESQTGIQNTALREPSASPSHGNCRGEDPPPAVGVTTHDPPHPRSYTLTHVTTQPLAHPKSQNTWTSGSARPRMLRCTRAAARTARLSLSILPGRPTDLKTKSHSDKRHAKALPSRGSPRHPSRVGQEPAAKRFRWPVRCQRGEAPPPLPLSPPPPFPPAAPRPPCPSAPLRTASSRLLAPPPLLSCSTCSLQARSAARRWPSSWVLP
jgi:hypothetical protein